MYQIGTISFWQEKAQPIRFQGHVVKLESWILKRLVFIFARAARRGHRPRQAGLRELMTIAGIPIPERIRTIPSS